MATPYFSPETVAFYRELGQNNNREWFEENKSRYQEQVIVPAQRFVEDLGERLRREDRRFIYDTRTNGAGSIFRIYKDVRFSKDKTPYKTHLGLLFWLGLSSKKMENPGFYVQVDETGAQIHCGHYALEGALLNAFREAVNKPKQAANLQAIFDQLQLQGYSTGREHYKRVPRGYDKDHPYAHLLRYNAAVASTPPINKTTLYSEDFIDLCFDHYKNVAPLMNWLGKHLYNTPV